MTSTLARLTSSADLPASSTRRRKVALAFPSAHAHLHELLRGIERYARHNGRWLLTASAEEPTLPLHSLQGWHGDGVIALIENDADLLEARTLRRRGIPVVTFSGSLSNPGVPRVSVDNPGIGKMAAEHLLSRGFRNLAFYGHTHRAYASLRANAFFAAARAADAPLVRGAAFPISSAPPVAHPFQDELAPLSRWLAKLPKPVGILAVNDFRARLLLDACERLRLDVPGDVGILGVDDNYVLCQCSQPTLSSVACDWPRVGFETARLLDQLMQGHTPPRQDTLIPPLAVEARQSTDAYHSDDPRISRALSFLHEHLGETLSVSRLVQATGASRRSLEEAFKRELGCSPYQYLSRTRVHRAKQLLTRKDAPLLKEVARRCGFSTLRRFRAAFHRIEGRSPVAYLHTVRKAERGNPR